MIEDSRTSRTKNQITHSLFLLMKEKDLSKITVTELAQLAEVDRKTFYLHYKGIEDVIREFQDQILQSSQDFDAFLEDTDPLENSFLLFEKIVSENLEFMKIFIQSGAYTYFFDHMKDMIQQRRKNWIWKKYPGYSEETKRKILMVMDSILASVFSLYFQWIEKNEDLSLQEVGILARTFVKDGLNGVIGQFNSEKNE
jgi:AcrR family transcriptional regulator